MQYLTAAQMKEEFEILYDKITNLAAPGYENEEISLFLNLSQERIIKGRINPKGNKYGESFEQTEKRRKDFSELIRDAVDGSGNLTTSISANQNGVLPNGTFFDLPLDFLYAITERIETDITCNGALKQIDVKPITHDQYNINVDNPFKQPDNNLAWRMDFSRENVSSAEKKRHEIITDGTYSPKKYYLRYIKRPQEIDIDGAVDCELDASLHREIVAKAVEIALEAIQDPRFQSMKIENNEIE
jgi:hypothetical protein